MKLKLNTEKPNSKGKGLDLHAEEDLSDNSLFHFIGRHKKPFIAGSLIIMIAVGYVGYTVKKAEVQPGLNITMRGGKETVSQEVEEATGYFKNTMEENIAIQAGQIEEINKHIDNLDASITTFEEILGVVTKLQDTEAAENTQIHNDIASVEESMAVLKKGMEELDTQQTTKLEQSFAEVMSSFDTMSQGFQKMDEGFADNQQGFEDTQKGFQKMEEGFKDNQQGFSDMTKGFETNASEFKKMEGEFAKTETGLANVMTAIEGETGVLTKALDAKLVEVQSTFDDDQANISKTLEQTKEDITALTDRTGITLTKQLDAANTAMNSAVKKITEANDALKQNVDKTMSDVDKHVVSGNETTQQLVKDKYDAMNTVLTGKDGVIEKINANTNSKYDLLNKSITDNQAALVGRFDKVDEAIKDVDTKIDTQASNLTTALNTSVTNQTTRIEDMFGIPAGSINVSDTTTTGVVGLINAKTTSLVKEITDQTSKLETDIEKQNTTLLDAIMGRDTSSHTGGISLKQTYDAVTELNARLGFDEQGKVKTGTPLGDIYNSVCSNTGNVYQLTQMFNIGNENGSGDGNFTGFVRTQFAGQTKELNNQLNDALGIPVNKDGKYITTLYSLIGHDDTPTDNNPEDGATGLYLAIALANKDIKTVQTIVTDIQSALGYEKGTDGYTETVAKDLDTIQTILYGTGTGTTENDNSLVGKTSKIQTTSETMLSSMNILVGSDSKDGIKSLRDLYNQLVLNEQSNKSPIMMQFTAITSELENSEHGLSAILAEVTNTRTDLANQRTVLQNIADTNQAISNEVQQQGEALANSYNALTGAYKELTQAYKDLKETKEENSNLKNQVNQLTSDKEKLEAANTALQEKNKNLQEGLEKADTASKDNTESTNTNGNSTNTEEGNPDNTENPEG